MLHVLRLTVKKKKVKRVEGSMQNYICEDTDLQFTHSVQRYEPYWNCKPVTVTLPVKDEACYTTEVMICLIGK